MAMFFETDLIRLGRTPHQPNSKSGSRLAEDYGVDGHLAALRSPVMLQASSGPNSAPLPSTPASSSVLPIPGLSSFAAFSNMTRGFSNARQQQPSPSPLPSTPSPGGVNNLQIRHPHGDQHLNERHRAESPAAVMYDEEEEEEEFCRPGGGTGAKGRRGRHANKSKHRSRSSMRYADVDKPPRRASKLIGQSANSLSTLSGKIQLSMMSSGLMPLSRARLSMKDGLNAQITCGSAEESRAISALTTRPVEVENFPKYMEQRRKYPVLLKVEFVTATRTAGDHSTRHGLKFDNEQKNQNQKIIPYDFNRVVLEKLPGQPESDYINASYLDSINHPKAYIVTQGPKENTIGDFWRMVWQEHSPCIIMLTKTFDFIKVMCVQYWPAAKGQEEVYGGIGVTVVQEEQLANFFIRTIRLRKENSERVMKQFHFTEWTCHSCPFPSALLEYRRRIRHYLKGLGVHQTSAEVVQQQQQQGAASVASRKPSLTTPSALTNATGAIAKTTTGSPSSLAPSNSAEAPSKTAGPGQKSTSMQNLLQAPFSGGRRSSSAISSQVFAPGPAEELGGPLIVHCNDGAGRSGVFLAIDANLCSSEEDRYFSVYPYLKKMKQARRGLIETMDQYKFVYEALEESVICGKTWFPVCELSQHLKSMSMRDPRTKMNAYQEQFLRISKLAAKFSIGDCAGGHRPENREKNRDVIIVPPDNYRPYLTSFQGNACTDYINAVFVDGYTRPREYIVTEWPIISTISDFWSLVYDQEGSAIVVLCDPKVSSGYTRPKEYVVTEWPIKADVVPDFWSLVYDYDCPAVVVLCTPEKTPTSPPFWPENSRSRKYGNVFTLEMISKQEYPNIRSWIFRINKKIVSLTELMAGVKAEPKTCQLFQLTCWPDGHKVPLSTNSLVELMNMVERWRAKTDYGPVVVVSQDGCARCGVYCAANACIEQVIQHGEVDIFQAVKTVRRHRPHLIQNMTEYKYCYDLVLHYVLHYLHKT